MNFLVFSPKLRSSWYARFQKEKSLTEFFFQGPEAHTFAEFGVLLVVLPDLVPRSSFSFQN